MSRELQPLSKIQIWPAAQLAVIESPMALLSLCSSTFSHKRRKPGIWSCSVKTDLTSLRSLPGVLDLCSRPNEHSLAEIVTNVASTLMTLSGPGDFGLTCGPTTPVR